ncbi:MotE family protein [Desulfovulcanus sp.]
MAAGVIKLALFLIVGMQSEYSPSYQKTNLELTKPAIAASKPKEKKKSPSSKKKEQPPVNISAELKRLKDKEKELAQKEQSLKLLEKELNARLEQLQKIEASLKKMLEEANVLKDKKIRHLVDMYANMKPKQAAQVLSTVDEDLAVKILSGMRGRKAGEILSYVEAKKAAKLSEKLTQLHAPFTEDTK